MSLNGPQHLKSRSGELPIFGYGIPRKSVGVILMFKGPLVEDTK